jgi:hypothetical protein
LYFSGWFYFDCVRGYFCPTYRRLGSRLDTLGVFDSIEAPFCGVLDLPIELTPVFDANSICKINSKSSFHSPYNDIRNTPLK